MNIRGIELMRSVGLRGPINERIVKNISELSEQDINRIYEADKTGAAIVVLDYAEKINQVPYLEKNVKKYRIARENFIDEANILTELMLKKGVKKENLRYFIAHLFNNDNTAFAGRIKVNQDNLFIDVMKGARTARVEFNPGFIYSCPRKGENLIRSLGTILKNDIDFPNKLLQKLYSSISKLYMLNPNIDFEIYRKDLRISYRDMFLDIK